jgi:hypothetical protein
MDNLMKCPTCGHRHPNGAGLWSCDCVDCHLIFHSDPSILSKESQERRWELIRRAHNETV